MLPLAKILLPVDFSGRSALAVRYALQLAGHYESELTLLHVLAPIGIPPHEYPELYVGAVSQDLIAQRRERARAHLESFLDEEARYPRLVREMVEGDPARTIVERARSGNYDLVLMPTHGHGPFRRLLMGSVTSKVLHDVQCPVWTGVHVETPRPAEPLRIERVLCAVDLGPHSAAVLDRAARVAEDFHASLGLLHVVALDPRTEAYYFSPEWRGRIFESARAELEKLEATAGTHAELRLEAGDVRKSVCAAAVSYEANLLVTGRGAATGIGRLTSRAYAIIRDSPCPVLSV